jgi:hypothetical protein
MVCKMLANQALVLCTLTMFGNFYVSRRSHEVWSYVYGDRIALAILLGSVAVASSVAAVGTLVIFSGN